MVTSVFFRSVGVDGAAGGFGIVHDLFGTSARRAFEEHVFGEMGDTMAGQGFVTRSGPGEDADSDAAPVRHVGMNEPQTVGKFFTVIGHHVKLRAPRSDRFVNGRPISDPAER